MAAILEKKSKIKNPETKFSGQLCRQPINMEETMIQMAVIEKTFPEQKTLK